MTVSNGRNLSIGAIVAGIGGAVAVVGAFLPWETMKAELAAMVGTDANISGFSSGSAGKLVTVFGIIVVVVAVTSILNIKLPVPVRTSLVGAGAALLLVALWGFLGISKDVDNGNALVPGLGAIGMGMYLSVVGGIVALVGGVLGMTMKAE